MRIGIVILNWNGKKLLEKNLNNVIDKSNNSKIYIIDNNSSDGSQDFIKKKFPSINIIELDKNYGFAEGYNVGLKNISEELICIMNNDIEVSDNWLDPILIHFDKNPDSIAQPLILDYKNRKFFEYAGAAGGYIDKFGYPYCRGRIFDSIEENHDQYKDEKIFWASGACMIIPKKIFIELNGFDDYFFAHMEEIDLCWRAFNKGYECFSISDSYVYHEGAVSIKRNSKKIFLNYRNSLVMLTKNLPINLLLKRLSIRLILDLISALRYLFNGKINYSYAIFKAHVEYFKIVSKILNQRDNNLKNQKYFGVNSIVIDYFVFGKKKFFRL